MDSRPAHSTRASKARFVNLSPKSRRKPVVKPTAKTNSAGQKATQGLPDLDPIIDAFVDAQALVLVAFRTMERGSAEDRGPAELVLRRGIGALEKALDHLEEAERQLTRFRSAGGVL